MKAALVFLCSLVVSSSYAAPYVHPETGLSFPDTVAGLKRAEVVVGTGVTIPYRSKTVEGAVIIRTIDPAKVTTPEPLVEDSLAMVQQLAASGVYAEVQVFRLPAGSGVVGWASATFTARQREGPLMAIICATLKGNYAIKARLTSADPKNTSMKAFVEELQRLVEASKAARPKFRGGF